MSNHLFLFRNWVPEWLGKLTLIIVVLPSLVLFFLPLANINAAAGNTGIETYDVYFAVVLFYAGYTSFYALERRFFSFLAAKEYFIIITFIQIASAYICYSTEEVALLFIFRFVQGMAFTMTVNLSLTLIFMQLTTERARTIGYSLFFGMLISMIPFNNFVTAEIIDAFNFNVIYKCAMFSYLPGLGLLLLIMNNIRLTGKFPLYQLDWASFLYYAIIVTLIGYVMVYGQEYYWLTDSRILFSCIAIVVLTALFVLRQLKLKRPYFHMEVFKYRNFWLGGLILLIFYICRFAFGISTGFFQFVLKLDPIHIGYLTLFNIGGIALGVFLSCVYVLQHRPIRLLWIYGFSLLLVFHFWLIFLFIPEVNESAFYSPVFLQGLGAGTLMTPTIIFIISSVPEKYSVSAAGICLFMRCFGFYLSVALINFFDLFFKSKHFDTFMAQTSTTNPVVSTTFLKLKAKLLGHGIAPDLAAKASKKLFLGTVRMQSQIRYSIDYYEMICIMLVFTLILVSLFPYINRTYMTLRKKQTPF